MSPETPSRTAVAADLSLADVLAALQDATLPARRRQEMRSALRTIARVLDKPLERIPANPRLLAARLCEVAPSACGISRVRWNNIRSLACAALGLVQPMSPGRQRNALSPAWSRLFEQLGSPDLMTSLSRFLRFCSARGIDPDNVYSETFNQFRLFLADTLLKKPGQVYARTVRAWRAAQAAIEDWPRLTVQGPERHNKWTLGWERFSPSLRQDFNVWRERLAGRELLAFEEMPIRPVKPGTLARREWQVRAVASALVHRGRDPATICSLRDLVEIDAIKQGLRYFLDRHSNRPTTAIADMAAALKAIAQHHVHVDAAHLDQLRAIVRRLAPDRRGLTQANRARLRQLDDQHNALSLLNLPAALMGAGARHSNRRRGAVQAQLAVAIEILLMAPIRIGNLARLDLERHLVRPGRGNGFHIVIEPEEVKNREPLEYPLPAETVQLIERYLCNHRPYLAPLSSTALFPGRGGGPKHPQAFGLQISQTVRHHTGLRVHAHLFRHIAGKLFLDANPGAYEVIRRVLGHRSIDTTTSYYTGLETAAAVRHFDNTILKLRDR